MPTFQVIEKDGISILCPILGGNVLVRLDNGKEICHADSCSRHRRGLGLVERVILHDSEAVKNCTERPKDIN